MQSKDERKRTERLLASRKVTDVLPALLWWHDAENDSLAERIETVNQLQFRVSAERDGLVHLFQFGRNDAEACHEAV